MGTRGMNQMEAFRILASADRQIVLHELLETDGEASVEELSQRVAARRHKIASDRIGERKVKRARTRLVHSHLPKLQETGVITVDWAENEMALRDGVELDRLFDAAAEVESWPPDDLLEQPAGAE